MTLGRRKGSAAEREVAELLRAWWDSVEPGVIFKRTPGSGGWSSPDARAAFKTAGDLVTTAARFPWCVEVKRREGWSWATLRAGRASPVWGWWAQAGRQAAECGLEPMLLFRRSREPWSAMVKDSNDLRWALPPGAYSVIERVEGGVADYVVVAGLAGVLALDAGRFARPKAA